MGGEACNVFFDVVGDYLWRILGECSRLKDRADKTLVPTARLATWHKWGSVKMGSTRLCRLSECLKETFGQVGRIVGRMFLISELGCRPVYARQRWSEFL